MIRLEEILKDDEAQSVLPESLKEKLLNNILLQLQKENLLAGAIPDDS